MRESTLKITTGAMFIAIFGMILLLNRQTGGLMEEAILYFLPIPMVAYAAKYGWKSGIPVFIAMCLTTIFCSTPTSIFYASTEAFLGLIFGGCIYRKIDMTKTLLTVMILSAVFNVLNTIVLAGLFGNDLQAQIQVMQESMVEAFNTVAANYPEGTQMPDISAMLDTSFLMRMMIISMILFGLAQGFLIYQLSLLILRRLRFSFPKPKSIYEMYPPRWTGYLALGVFLLYYLSAAYAVPENLQVIAQTVGMCGYLYLVIFGILGIFLFLKPWIPSGIIRGILCFLVFLMFGQLGMIVGFFYICLNYHDRWLEKARAKDAAREGGRRENASERQEYGPVQKDDTALPEEKNPAMHPNHRYSQKKTGKPSISDIAKRKLSEDDR